MGRYGLALDQGATSSRAILFDRQGRIAAAGQQEYARHYPQSGRVEHDANDIWRSQPEVAQAVLKKHHVAAGDAEGCRNSTAGIADGWRRGAQ